MHLLISLAVGSLLAASTASDLPTRNNNTAICESLYADFSLKVHHLPSEIPVMGCRCVGISVGQSCPLWTIVAGSQDVEFTKNESLKNSNHSCTSYIQVRLKRNSTTTWHTKNFTAECVGDQKKRQKMIIIKKSYSSYTCNEDEDCLLSNQRCEVQKECSRDCIKVCQCVEPTPIFIAESPDICYSQVGFGSPCNYSLQCQTKDLRNLICLDSDNGTLGTCNCPDEYTYDGKHQACMIIKTEPLKQTLTERIMIAVCCGIVGIFIFVFVSYICSKNFRQLRHHLELEDVTEDPESNQPLTGKSDLPDKPPSYQESQKAEMPVNLPADSLTEEPVTENPGHTNPEHHVHQDPNIDVSPILTVVPDCHPSAPPRTKERKTKPGSVPPVSETDF